MLMTTHDAETVLTTENLLSITIKEENGKFSAVLDCVINDNKKEIVLGNKELTEPKVFNQVTPWLNWIKRHYPSIKKIAINLE